MVENLTLEHVVTIIIGLALFVVFLFLLALAQKYGPGIVNGFKERRPIVGIRYVEPDEAPEREEPVAPPVATTATIDPQPIAMTTTDRNTLLLYAKAEALAAMVRAGKVGETEGIKIVYGLSPSGSNPRYTEARSALKAALGALERRYPTTPDEERAIQEKRSELGLV
jgi:hypothetical protein